ncbi:unnamed protein product [Effrenium voratum]|nr:unnamed protein product [Effrenium voratum]
MDALRAPVDAIRRRLHRGIALRRAVPANEVNVEAMKSFWSSLPPEVRMEVLRFTDSGVVQRVHDYMIKLLKADDIWSHMNDVSTEGAPAPRLQGFEFEAPAERDCLGALRAPVALMATEEFAADENLFETIERELGGVLLGRPALQQKDWSTVFDVSPSSWEELQQQVYRLVELAIFHAERDPYFQLLRDSAPGPRRRRRKAKKMPATKPACDTRDSQAQGQRSENMLAAATNEGAAPEEEQQAQRRR